MPEPDLVAKCDTEPDKEGRLVTDEMPEPDRVAEFDTEPDKEGRLVTDEMPEPDRVSVSIQSQTKKDDS